MIEVPKWFDDPDAPWPCPCGRPAAGTMVLVENDFGSRVLLHESCLQRLIHGMEDE